MTACPHCHVYKGLWSPLSRNENGHYICSVNMTHRFTRDNDGNYHPLSNG